MDCRCQEQFKTNSTTNLKVQEDSAGNVLAGASFREKGVESIVATTNGLVRGHLTVRLDTMLQTVQLPAGIANLDTGLTNVDGDDLTHGDLVDGGKRRKGEGSNSKTSGEQERAFLQVVKFQKLQEAFEANANGGLLCYATVVMITPRVANQTNAFKLATLHHQQKLTARAESPGGRTLCWLKFFPTSLFK